MELQRAYFLIFCDVVNTLIRVKMQMGLSKFRRYV